VGGPRATALPKEERVPAYGLRRRRRLTATHPYGRLSGYAVPGQMMCTPACAAVRCGNTMVRP